MHLGKIEITILERKPPEGFSIRRLLSYSATQANSSVQLHMEFACGIAFRMNGVLEMILPLSPVLFAIPTHARPSFICEQMRADDAPIILPCSRRRLPPTCASPNFFKKCFSIVSALQALSLSVLLVSDFISPR